MHGCMGEYKDRRCMHECKYRWNGCTHAVWVSTTMHGWVDKWILACMDGKVDGDVCTNMSTLNL